MRPPAISRRIAKDLEETIEDEHQYAKLYQSQNKSFMDPFLRIEVQRKTPQLL